MRSSSSAVPLPPPLNPRTSSEYWCVEHRKDFDPTAKIDQSVFDDADEDNAKNAPAAARRASSVDQATREASYDLMRFPSSDFRMSSSGSVPRAPSDDSYLKTLFAASVAYEEASRIASSDSARFPSTESALGAIRAGSFSDSYPRSVNSDVVQSLLASIVSSNADQRLKSYDFISEHILNDGRNPAPAPPAQNKKPDKAVSAKVPSSKPKPPKTNLIVPPSKKNEPNRVYIDEICEKDVVCGRGGKSNHHWGNKKYRQVVSEMKEGYRGISAKTAKTDLSRKIVDHVLEYGGRFVKRDAKTGRYFILTHDEARKKTSQALRETKILKWTIEADEKKKKAQAAS